MQGLGFIRFRVYGVSGLGFMGFRALMRFIGFRGSLVDPDMGHLDWGIAPSGFHAAEGSGSGFRAFGLFRV